MVASVGTWSVCNSAYLSSCSADPLLAFRHTMWRSCIYCRLCTVKGLLHTDWVTDWALLCCATCVAYERRKTLSCFHSCARSRPMLVLRSLSLSFSPLLSPLLFIAMVNTQNMPVQTAALVPLTLYIASIGAFTKHGTAGCQTMFTETFHCVQGASAAVCLWVVMDNAHYGV